MCSNLVFLCTLELCFPPQYEQFFMIQQHWATTNEPQTSGLRTYGTVHHEDGRQVVLPLLHFLLPLVASLPEVQTQFLQVSIRSTLPYFGGILCFISFSYYIQEELNHACGLNLPTNLHVTYRSLCAFTT